MLNPRAVLLIGDVNRSAEIRRGHRVVKIVVLVTRVRVREPK